MPSDEVWLKGNMGGVAKSGDTVHRAVGRWTPAVHTFLAFLAPEVPHIPRVFGFDDQGREVLEFMPGRVIDDDGERLSDKQVVSLVSWTRRFHMVAEGFEHPGPWRYFPIPRPTMIGHNDIAPYNVCFNGDDLVGVFDWDMSGPTTPLNELAFIAWNCVPLWADGGVDSAAQRLELIAATYGRYTADQVLTAVPNRIQVMLDGIPASAAAGDKGMADLLEQGEPERSSLALEDLLGRLAQIRRRLRDTIAP